MLHKHGKGIMNKLLLKLYANDPGWLRLKQASKTIIAILTTILVLTPANSVTTLCAGMFTGFAMQSHQGTTRQQQMITVLFAYPALTTTFLLGCLAKPYPPLSATLLVALGFIAFAVQRFGQRFMVFPIFCWALCFVGTVFPKQPYLQIAYDLSGILIAWFVTFIIYFYLWPKRPAKIFFENLRQYYSSYRKTLIWLARFYKKKDSAENFLQELPEKMQILRKTLLMNEAIYTSISSTVIEVNNTINQQHLEQYAKSKALGMLIESTQQIAIMHIEFAEPIRKVILNLIKEYAKIFQSIKIDSNAFTISWPEDLTGLTTFLSQFRFMISQEEAHPTDDIVYLLNIYFGFRQLSKVLREKNEI